MQSKILSGGVQDRFYHIFSKKTIKKIQELTDITKDTHFTTAYTPEGLPSSEPVLTSDDELLLSVLHGGRSLQVDHFIAFLQRGFAKTVMWGSVGGLIAESMVRSAFAPII